MAKKTLKKKRSRTFGTLDMVSQRRTSAITKKASLKRSGFDSRVLGHVSGSGKRAQARRDSKSR